MGREKTKKKETKNTKRSDFDREILFVIIIINFLSDVEE